MLKRKRKRERGKGGNIGAYGTLGPTELLVTTQVYRVSYVIMGKYPPDNDGEAINLLLSIIDQKCLKETKKLYLSIFFCIILLFMDLL